MTTMNIILVACMGFMMFVQMYHFVMLETRRKTESTKPAEYNGRE